MARKDGMDRLLFPAREGGPLFEARQILYPDSPIKADYLFASRRCLRIASMQQIGRSEVDFLLSGKYPISAEDVFKRLGWEHTPLASKAQQTAKWDFRKAITSGHERDQFREGLKSLEKEFLELSSAERAAYLHYLKSLDLLPSTRENVGIVDVGWQGSMQQSLQELLAGAGSGVQLHGYYLGTMGPLAPGIKAHSNGLILEDSLPRHILEIVKTSRELIETLFPSEDPTLLWISPQNGKPVFAGKHENHVHLDNLMLMRRTAMEHLQTMGETWKRNPAEVERDWINRLGKLLRAPSRREAGILGDLYWNDGYGGKESTVRLAQPESAPLNLAGLAREYRHSYWRAGFLARLSAVRRFLLKPLLIGMPTSRLD